MATFQFVDGLAKALTCECTTWTFTMDEVHDVGEHHPSCPEGQPKPADADSDD